MNREVDAAWRAAQAELKRVGAAHAKGDALALCYATAAAIQFALTEKSCFAALRRVPDQEKLDLLHRWRVDPFAAVNDALDAMQPTSPLPKPESFQLELI